MKTPPSNSGDLKKKKRQKKAPKVNYSPVLLAAPSLLLGFSSWSPDKQLLVSCTAGCFWTKYLLISNEHTAWLRRYCRPFGINRNLIFFFFSDATIQDLNIQQVFFSGNETVIVWRKTCDSLQLIRQKEWPDRRAFFSPFRSVEMGMKMQRSM